MLHLRISRRLRTLFLSTALACAVLPASVLAQYTPAPQTDLPRAQLHIGRQKITVQLATTPLQRQIGLMHRATMPTNEGMLFVFDDDHVQCFWMKNTLLPLTAAFVDAQGTIVNLADMQPHSEQSHCSARAVPYVLEMRQGWFKRNRILPGMKIRDVQNRYFQSQ